MKHEYIVEGMTCQSCVSKVKESLEAVKGVSSANVNLDNKTAEVAMSIHIKTSDLSSALASKYTLTEKDVSMPTSGFENMVETSKLAQLKPLFIILLYIAVASILLHKDDLVVGDVMLDFMGLFFIVFSFFKMLDISGFADSFSMYDPLAKMIPIYGKIYPFIETALGLMLLMRFNIDIALVLTILVLGVTTFGVTKTLLAKQAIKRACLGTALNLPMTEATFIENAIMILMSIAMLAIF